MNLALKLNHLLKYFLKGYIYFLHVFAKKKKDFKVIKVWNIYDTSFGIFMKPPYCKMW